MSGLDFIDRKKSAWTGIVLEPAGTWPNGPKTKPLQPDFAQFDFSSPNEMSPFQSTCIFYVRQTEY